METGSFQGAENVSVATGELVGTCVSGGTGVSVGVGGTGVSVSGGVLVGIGVLLGVNVGVFDGVFDGVTV